MVEEIIKELPKGLLNWYEFQNCNNILYIGECEDSIAYFLSHLCKRLKCIRLPEELLKGEKFDYIVAIGQLEYEREPAKHIQMWSRALTSEGKLILGVDNRFGLRYFCGDRDKFTGRNFDSIEGYRRALENKEGQAYSKAELIEFLEVAGIKQYRFYSVLPNLEFPQLIYGENYLPQEELAGRYFPKYNSPSTIFLEEEYLYTDIIKNGMFHAVANAYLIECTNEGILSSTLQVTTSMDRGRDKAFATIIHNDDTVEKKALYQEGEERLIALHNNMCDLEARGIKIIKGCIKKSSYIMPYVKGESLVVYLRKLLFEDKNKFIEAVDKFRDIIFRSSNHLRVDEKKGVILKKGYVDLVPLNAMYLEGEYVFFDQELYIEDYPANIILMRAISIIYIGDPKVMQYLPIEFFWKRYQLEEELGYYQEEAYKFIKELRNLEELTLFWQKYEKRTGELNTNRQKLNYSQSDYQRIFKDFLKDSDKKDIILFGSGNFAHHFLNLYSNRVEVKFIVDNNQSKWGTKMAGIEIQNPRILQKINASAAKVIICVKDYLAIVKQVEGYGIIDYGIYDTNLSYGMDIEKKESSEGEKKKKYTKGYVAGVFDMFHIGHLNILKKAKEQCEYLIVGVVTDEGVRYKKKTEPIISFSERLAIVDACKYVDQAVEIPYHYGGTEDAYRMYEFDCQFTGSDYADNVHWLGAKEYLKEKGADLVFIPYTDSISSSSLKRRLEKERIPYFINNNDDSNI